ncbi:MAG: hypothetical protein AB7I24_18300 [Candidatus Nanopelagicales bacterium]|jgi:hypothetical protein
MIQPDLTSSAALARTVALRDDACLSRLAARARCRRASGSRSDRLLRALRVRTGAERC